MQAYARSRSLPTAYISMFMAEAGKSSTDQITRDQFLNFVSSHERALKKAFQLFDKDGDGIIGVEDLEASLAHVAVSCCRTRCIYRAPRGLAHKLLAQTQAAGETDGRVVDFAAFRRFFMLLPRTEMALEFWLQAGAAIDCSEKRPPLALNGVATQKASAWGHLFAGAVAGATSRTVTAPLETLRLAVMTGSMQAPRAEPPLPAPAAACA
ncbi:hypothetical protein DUNSADRAFT_12246 [Dunaliella salina]|uniref:EF-hand domain-containing protein n=1 Tax=Dunaliella salina TaxID=3046 RepID=A0ABQ7GBK6_DUNSA|nr:hypothetical protein DUNSADRAFT_12246 [Dunaliella salina]|eukprot:KAF5832005.1 hypothetical protein DUNSADRAFT_12246 [Dunaliella salina]